MSGSGFGPGGPFPRALRLLLWLHVRGFWRRLVRNARTPKGIVLTVVGGVLLMLWLMPMLAGLLLSRRPGGDPEALSLWLPMAMLGMCVVTAVMAVGGRAVTFTAAETDFLFPGPFSKRQVLLYRLARTSLGAVFGSVFVAIAFGRQTGSPLGSVPVAFVLLLFVQFFSTACTQLGQILSARVSGTWQRLAVGAVLGAVLLAGLATAPLPMPGATTRPEQAMAVVTEKLIAVRDSWAMRVVGAPFVPFALAVSPGEWWVRQLWTLVAAGVMLGMLGICLRLDSDYMEASATASRKQAEMMQKALRTGVAYRVTSTRLRCPALPHWGGAGAIIRCQMTSGLRAVWKLVLILMAGVAAVLSVLAARGVADLTAPVMTLMVMLTLMGGGIFRFDFRSDVDRLDALKLLPMRSWALSAGQLATPVVMIGVLQWLLAGLLVLTRPNRWELAAGVAAFGPLVAVVLVGVENVAFLLVPSRLRTVTPGDLTALARTSLVFLAKMTSVGLVLGLAAVAGFAAGWATGTTAAGLVVAWVVAAAACLAVVPTVALAFDRLDVAEDAAPNS